MIRKIILENFMSHAHTVIELAEGLTVLVGPNNCGKSAIVAAIEALCNNTAGAFMVRHSQNNCRVTIETEDRHTLVWQRDHNIVTYQIDGETFERLNRDVPVELHKKLRMPPVKADGKEFDVHIGFQKAPIFLLNDPPSWAATFFASSSDAGKLMEMQQQHRRNTSEKNREQRKLTCELERDVILLTMLAPLDELEENVKWLENTYKELGDKQLREAALRKTYKAMFTATRQEASHKAQCDILTTLAKVPPFHETSHLKRLIGEITRFVERHERGVQTGSVLSDLSEPSATRDTLSLAKTIGCLADANHRREHCNTSTAILANLIAPPEPKDEDKLILLCRLWIDVTCWLPRTPGDRCAEAFSTPEVARKLVLGLDACFPPRMRKS